MTKKYKFNFYNGAGGMNDSFEIVELSEHLDENEIDLKYTFNNSSSASRERGLHLL